MTQKFTIRNQLLEAVKSEAEIPAFSDIATQLMDAVQDPLTDLDTIAEIAKLDPGITAKFLRLASSPSFSAKYLTSIKDALMVIGLEEAMRMATTIVVMGRFTSMKLKVDWELYWLHCLLTARLMEKLTASYRANNGKEYLAGLLHDIGKLYIGHHFPHEFEKVVVRAMAQGHGLHNAELELLDITHAELGANLSEKWKVHPDLVHAIRFHHETEMFEFPTDPVSGDKAFLTLCLHLADRMANITRANIQGVENLRIIRYEDLPGWHQLHAYPVMQPLALDLLAELKKAKDIISSAREPSFAK